MQPRILIRSPPRSLAPAGPRANAAVATAPGADLATLPNSSTDSSCEGQSAPGRRTWKGTATRSPLARVTSAPLDSDLPLAPRCDTKVDESQGVALCAPPSDCRFPTQSLARRDLPQPPKPAVRGTRYQTRAPVALRVAGPTLRCRGGLGGRANVRKKHHSRRTKFWDGKRNSGSLGCR